jgi:hypothetical protein
MTWKAILAVLVLGAISTGSITGCIKVVTPERVYLDTSSLDSLKIVQVSRSTQAETEYTKHIAGLQVMNEELLAKVDSLSRENLGLKSQVDLYKMLKDSASADISSYQAKWILYKNLLDECRSKK